MVKIKELGLFKSFFRRAAQTRSAFASQGLLLVSGNSGDSRDSKDSRGSRGSQAAEQRTAFLITCLFALQPVLDILSFWTIRLGYPSVVTTGLRAFFLAMMTVYAFILVPSKRRIQVLFIFLLAIFWLLHYSLAYQAGISSLSALVSDVNQYVKTVQLPIFVLNFYILFSRFYEVSWQSFLKGTTAAFWIIMGADLVAWLTQTGSFTYLDMKAGYLGWYHVANAQSIIISLLFPLALYSTWAKALVHTKQEKKAPQAKQAHQDTKPKQAPQTMHCPQKGRWLAYMAFLITLSIGGFRLFFFATRISYASLFSTTIALFVIFIFRDWKRSLFHLLLLALLGSMAYLLLPFSPMYQLRVNDEVLSEQKQKNLEKDLNMGRKFELVEHDLKILAPIYDYYLSDLVQEFGLEAVAEEYQYSTYFIELRNVRNKKIHFANLRMKQMPSYIKWTGLHFASMQVPGVEGSYDLETDPPAVFYYTGYIGVVFTLSALALLVFGLLYQLYKRGIRACLGDYRLLLQGYLFLFLVAASMTGGSVLRRPSVSIYLAFVWACFIYQSAQVFLERRS